MSTVLFGNPWHGRLGAGTIELEAGTPVSEITIEGVEYPVVTVAGNLGDTRYHLAPSDRATPETPDSIAALDGQFLRDFVLFSDALLYSPISDSAILENARQWLMWDTTAGRWRKMRVSWTTGLSTYLPPTNTSVIATVTMQRGQLFGGVNRDEPESWTTFATFDLPWLVYGFWTPWGELIDGTSEQLLSITVEPAPDGRKVLLRVEGHHWDGSTIGQPWEEGDPVWMTNAWEVVITGNGTGVTGPTHVGIPDDPETDDVLYVRGSISSTWWEWVNEELFIVAYHAQLHIEEQNNWRAIFAAFRCGAAYDSAGARQVGYYLRQANVQFTRSLDGDSIYFTAYLSEGDDPDDFDPGPGAPPTEWTLATEFYNNLPDNYPAWIDGVSPTVGDWSLSGTVDHSVIDENNDIIETWGDDIGDLLTEQAVDEPEELILQMERDRITNNVASARQIIDDVSVARVGTGAADVGDMSATIYASFNPRTGAVVSSDEPVGFV